MDLRSAVEGDLAALHALEVAVFGSHAYPVSVLRQYFDLLRPDLVVAEVEGGELAGYGVGGLCAGEPATGWVLAYGVDPRWRGRRLGDRILRELIRRLVARGAMRILATVSLANEASRRVCEGAGFEAVQTIADYFGPGEDRLVMQWRAEASG
ncbi:MAG: GNAT family N-acetyltransferase [Phycisphaeraceae bacterium]|nr:GNAT family N-acetyltransferase [Phycisphaeraceae bacterium]